MKRGFTVIEVVVVVGILATLAAIVWIRTVQPITTTPLDGALQVLLADLRQQQIHSMLAKQTADDPQEYGIYFDTTRYVLFSGTYVEGGAGNYEVELDPGITVETTFPSSQIIFERITGQVKSYAASTDTVTLEHQTDGQTRSFELNLLGVPIY